MKGKEIRYYYMHIKGYFKLLRFFNIKYDQYIDETATIHWPDEGKRLTNHEFKELKSKIRSLGYDTNKQLRDFDGDTELLIDCLEKSLVVRERYPDLFEDEHRIYIKSTEPNPFFENDAFAMTEDFSITINDYAFRSRRILDYEYDKLVEESWS